MRRAGAGLPVDPARQVGAVIGRIEIGRAEAHALERRLILRQRRRSRQRQHAGRGVVAARDAVLVGEVERIAAQETARDRNRRAAQRRTARVGDGEAGVERRRRAALRIAHRIAGAAQRRRHGNIPGNIHCACRGGGFERSVVDLPANRARGGARAGGGEGHRIQRRLILRQRRRSRQRQHAGRGAIRADNAVLIGETEGVAGLEVARNRHRRRSELEIVRVADRKRIIDHDGGAARRVGRGVARARQGRRLIDADDIDRAGHNGRLQRAGADPPIDRAGQVCPVIGRIEAARAERHAVERHVIGREAGRAGQRQRAGRRIVAAGNAALVGEVERVAGEQTAGDRDRSAAQGRTAWVGDRQARVERRRRAALRISRRHSGAAE